MLHLHADHLRDAGVVLPVARARLGTVHGAREAAQSVLGPQADEGVLVVLLRGQYVRRDVLEEVRRREEGAGQLSA